MKCAVSYSSMCEKQDEVGCCRVVSADMITPSWGQAFWEPHEISADDSISFLALMEMLMYRWSILEKEKGREIEKSERLLNTQRTHSGMFPEGTLAARDQDRNPSEVTTGKPIRNYFRWLKCLMKLGPLPVPPYETQCRLKPLLIQILCTSGVQPHKDIRYSKCK